MPVPDPGGVEIPNWLATIGSAIGVLATAALVGGREYLKRWFTASAQAQAPAVSKDIVLQGGSITDMEPVRRMAGHVEALSKATERQAEASERIVEELHEMSVIFRDMAKEAEMANRMKERGSGRRD